MAPAPLLEVRDLLIALQVEEGLVPVVDGISFALEPGKVLGLVARAAAARA